MNARSSWLGLILALIPSLLFSQEAKVDSIKFFVDTTIIEADFITDIHKLLNNNMKNETIDGRISFTDNGSFYNEPIRLSSRGQYRKENCATPSIKIYFRSGKPSRLSPLHTLKMVCACKTNEYYDQLLLKEYAIYKMYNLLTEKSFRVRLMHLNFQDTLKKKKPFSEYAFLIEDGGAMAKRNKCKEVADDVRMKTESTDRNQMTLVAVFEYMIGNTDWSVPYNHNVRLIKSKKDSALRPFVVPYDFDYAGLVNADYAVPAPELNIQTVLERNYRGFPRNPEELELVLAPMREKKEAIFSVIRNFQPLSKRNKDEMILYLEEFYDIINSKKRAQSVFIDNARTQ